MTDKADAIVICPGPSLATWIDPAAGPDAALTAAEHVIGVNRAVRAVRCGWWAALDVHTIGWVAEQGGPLGCPGLITSRQTHVQAVKRYPRAAAGRPWIEFRERIRLGATNEEELAIGWRTRSALVAAVVAAWMACGRRLTASPDGDQTKPSKLVRVFGCDLEGTADFDEFTHKKQKRDPRRWKKEAGIWGDVTARLAERGVRIERAAARHSQKPAEAAR